MSDETIAALCALNGGATPEACNAKPGWPYTLALLSDLLGGEAELLAWAEAYQYKVNLFFWLNLTLGEAYTEGAGPPDPSLLVRHAWFAQSLMTPLPAEAHFDEVIGHHDRFVLTWTKETVSVRVRSAGEVIPDTVNQRPGLFSCSSPVVDSPVYDFRPGPLHVLNGWDRTEREVAFYYDQVVLEANQPRVVPRTVVLRLNFDLKARSFSRKNWVWPFDADVMKAFMLDQLRAVADEYGVPFQARAQAEVALMQQSDVGLMMRAVVNPHFGADALHVPYRLMVREVPEEWQYSIQARAAYLRLLEATGGDETLSTEVLRRELAANPNALTYLWEFNSGPVWINRKSDDFSEDFELLVEWGPVPRYWADQPYGAQMYLRIVAFTESPEDTHQILLFEASSSPQGLGSLTDVPESHYLFNDTDYLDEVRRSQRSGQPSGGET